MYCKVCGENLKPDAKFCENCGTKVVKEAEAGSKGDIKNCAEPINKKVEIEETKTSKENHPPIALHFHSNQLLFLLLHHLNQLMLLL